MSENEKDQRREMLDRVPERGWDCAIDVRRADRYLRDTGDTIPTTDSDDANRERIIASKLRQYARTLRSYGIRRYTTTKKIAGLLHGRIVTGEIPLPLISKAAKFIYATETNPPGMESAAGDREADKMGFLPRGGKPNASIPSNIGVAMLRLGVDTRYDSFADRYYISGLRGHGPALDDAAANHLRFVISENYEFTPDKQLTFDYLYDNARKNRFDPVNEYFDAKQESWDHAPRIDRFLIDYAGAADTPYVRAISKLFFLAVVHRNRNPGAKFDEMIVLESVQGKGKSSALAILALKPDWFSDSFPMDADNRETLEHAQGKIVIEVAELQGMRKADTEHVKAMLSRTTDRGRLAYARTPVEVARRFVFVGTSNGREYLQDATGNRRFWPVAVKGFDLAALKRDRDQLWGEAAFRDALGLESIRLDADLWEAAGIEQDKRQAINADPFTDTLREHLGDMAGRITAEDAWTILGVDAGRRTPELNRRFGGALKALGWRPITIKLEHGKQAKRARGYGNGTTTRRIIAARHGRGVVVVGYEDNLTEGVSGDFTQSVTAEHDFG
jgi:hypothetical protein